MVKTIYNYGPHPPQGGPFPPPPPLPPYDPNEEAPKWDWYRIWWHFPKFEQPDRPKRVGETAQSDDKPDWRGVVKNNVIPLPKLEPYNFTIPQDPKYWFFDTPDYADPFKKLWFSLKWFTLTGSLTATFWGIVEGKVVNVKDSRYLLSRYVAPWVFGGMVFSTSVITIANLRNNKDDLYNYFFAGLVAGAATGRANYLAHFRHTIFWCTAGMIAKENAEINGTLHLRMTPRAKNWGLSGFNAEGGFWTGDLRIRTSHPSGDPGRDTKTYAS